MTSKCNDHSMSLGTTLGETKHVAFINDEVCTKRFSFNRHHPESCLNKYLLKI